MSFKKLCKKYFGSADLYEILGVSRDATEHEIKKGYHRMSLRVHPDRVDEDQKKVATEKFKVLGKIHSILQHEERRRQYNEHGDTEFDDDDEDCSNWMEYWRSIFKKIDLKDIERYEEEYKGSQDELRDIKKAYVSSKGDMNKLHEMVPFANIESEPRYISIVRKMVEDGEVEEYDAFFNENPRKKGRRHKKLAKEREDAEQVDMEELEKKMAENARERLSAFQNLISKYENDDGEQKKGKRKSIKAGGGGEKKRAKRAKK